MIDRLMEAERLIMELRARLGALEQRVSEVSQSTGKVWGAVGSAGQGGGIQASYWVMVPAGGSPASTGTFPTITPSYGNLTVYASTGGTLTALGTATVRWWYRDSLPQYTLVPVQPCADGSFDALCNSCTIVNP